MILQRQDLEFSTDKPISVCDMTPKVQEAVKRMRILNGLLMIASLHTTLALVINERCEKLREDMVVFLTRLAPPTAKYRHNEIAIDGRPNAHSHLLSLLLPSQVTVAVKEGEMDLGQWQSIFAVELDGPRTLRKIRLTFVGD